MSKEGGTGSASPAETKSFSSHFLEEISSRNPSEVIVEWDRDGRLGKILPEVVALKGIEQRPDYHLEGDVWTHTLLVLQNLPQDASLNLKMAALLHDVGKQETTSLDASGKISSIDHQMTGAEMAGRIIDRFSLNCPQVPLDKERIVWLVRYHLVGQGSAGEALREVNIRRFFLTLDGKQMSDQGRDLMALIKADSLGRKQVNEKPKLATFDATVARIEEIIAKSSQEKLPPLPVPDGHGIMKLFLVGRGPVVGQIRGALVRIHQEVGFIDETAGERVALLLSTFIGPIKPGAREIDPDILSQAIERTVEQFQRENTERRFGQQTIRVMRPSYGDQTTPKEVVGSTESHTVVEREACKLIERRARILVLGSHGGSPAFAQALTTSLKELVAKLPFSLAIQEIVLNEKIALAQRSRQLTRPQIQEAENHFKIQGGNIVVASCPSESPDDLMLAMAQSAHCAILVASAENDTRYQRKRDDIRRSLKNRNIPLAAEYRLRPKGQIKDSTGEEVTSETRIFVPEKYIAGQIVGLEINQEERDSVIDDLAKALLFSILPRMKNYLQEI